MLDLQFFAAIFGATWAQVIGYISKNWWSAENSVWFTVHSLAPTGVMLKSQSIVHHGMAFGPL
jgi:hypothetical protein